MDERLRRVVHLARTAANRPGLAVGRLLRRRTTPLAPYADETLNRETLERLKGLSRSAQRPFPNRRMLFVFGIMPRSGTNFLQDLLCRYEEVERPALPIDELPLLSAADFFAAANPAIFANHPPSARGLPDLAWMAYAAAGLRNHLLDLSGGPGLVVVKEPQVLGLELFPALFPHDRCLIVFRSGRHVVDSYMRTFAQGTFSRTFEDVCAECAAAMEKALRLCESLPAETVLRVQYEEASADRAGVASRILTWAGHEPRIAEEVDLDEMPVLGSSVHSREAGGEVTWKPRAADSDFNPAARQIDWTPAQEAAFERICGEVNRRAGYS